jgi:hypothetical protein
VTYQTLLQPLQVAGVAPDQPLLFTLQPLQVTYQTLLQPDQPLQVAEVAVALQYPLTPQQPLLFTLQALQTLQQPKPDHLPLS